MGNISKFQYFNRKYFKLSIRNITTQIEIERMNFGCNFDFNQKYFNRIYFKISIFNSDIFQYFNQKYYDTD